MSAPEDTLDPEAGGTRPVETEAKTIDAPSQPGPPVGQVFRTGELVAQRYRILRFIAMGGMGEVYEAKDLELGETVALKTLGHRLGWDANLIDRFKREIQLARKVTHPNVARIYDLGYHRTSVPSREISFLTMEMLEGETLSERLRTKGRMTSREALPIIEQIAAGLGAAHSAGVVHRDFKPSNVILVDTPGRPGEVRAVITDFGIARGYESGSGAGAQITDTGVALGTPEYMAPEQLTGDSLSPATDIYALGIVLYQLVTGVLPFSGQTPLSVMSRRLTESPLSPRNHVRDIDPAWEATILRCMAREPADRFATTGEVLRALKSQARARPRRRQVRSKYLVAAAALVAAALLLFLIPRLAFKWAPKAVEPPRARTALTKPRRSLAVTGFRNLSGRPDAAWLSTALAEMLTTEIASFGGIRVLSGDIVARARTDLSLPEGASLERASLLRLRDYLGADLIVLGSYIALGPQQGSKLRLDIQIQDAQLGDVIGAATETGTESDLFDLVARCGARLRTELGAPASAQAQARPLSSSLPSDPEIVRLYSEGLIKLRQLDALGARPLLEKAVAAKPSFALAQSALAACWSALGYEEKAASASKRALDASKELPFEERMLIEGRYYESVRDWEKAVASYRALFEMSPDSLEYGLRLAGAETSAGKAAEALKTLGGLRLLAPPSGDDPRIDMAEAQAFNVLGDYAREKAAAEKAERAGMERGARLLVASAQLEMSADYGYLGDLQKAVDTAEQAHRSYSELGDRAGAGEALLNLARGLWLQGRFAEALKNADRSLALFREIGNQSRTGWVLNLSGITRHYQGDLRGGGEQLDRALACFRDAADKTGITAALVNKARVLMDWGELKAARAVQEQAVAMVDQTMNRNHSGHSKFILGELLFWEGDLERSRSCFEAAVEIWKQVGRKSAIAESYLSLAEISLNQGRAQEAEKLALDGLRMFEQVGILFRQAWACDILARCMIASKRIEDARRYLARGQQISANQEHFLSRIGIERTEATLQALSGDTRGAISLLESALAEARRRQFAAVELEIQLALAQAEMMAGRGTEARSRRAALAVSATARGYGLIARMANEAAKGGS
ncbi:MAG: protein kinase [Acidobacteriota bacterium]